MNQNVFRCYLMGERCHDFAAVVAQVEGDIYRILWHGYQKDILETLGVLGCLWIGEPFLEERREGIAVDYFARTVVAHGNLSVTFYRQLAESLFLTIPAWQYVQLVNGNHLLVAVAGKSVINSQCLVNEIIVKILRLYLAGSHEHG